MSGNKLEYFLHRMPVSEQKAFTFYLKSNQSKKGKTFASLSELLAGPKRKKQRIYALLYPEKGFSDSHWRNLRSELLNILMNWLTQKEYDQSGHQPLFMARALNRLQATRYWDNLIGPNPGPQKHSLNGQNLNFLLNVEQFIHQKSVQGRKNLSPELLLPDAEEAFVARLLYLKIAQHEADYIKADQTSTRESILWPGILQQLEQGAWSDVVLVQIYYTLFKLSREPQHQEHFQQLRNYLDQYGNQVAKGELQEIYTGALNHCILQFNQGETNYMGEIFALYATMLEADLLISEGSLSAWHFKSIVRSGLYMKKFTWVENFIQEHEAFLPPQFRDNLLNFSLGMLHFYKGEYMQAETRMNHILADFQDPFFGLDARAWLLRIYFETHNETGMTALLNSFRLYLRRYQGLAPERLKNYQEFVRFFRRLLSLPPGNEKRAHKLLQEIQESPHQAGRAWFIEKIKALHPQMEAGSPLGQPAK